MYRASNSYSYFILSFLRSIFGSSTTDKLDDLIGFDFGGLYRARYFCSYFFNSSCCILRLEFTYGLRFNIPRSTSDSVQPFNFGRVFGSLYLERYCFSYCFISSCFALRFALKCGVSDSVPMSVSCFTLDDLTDFGCL